MHDLLEPKKTYKVGVLVPASQQHMREVALGVVHYTQLHPHWQVEGDGFHPLVPWKRLQQWQGDGLVAVVNTHEQMQTLSRLNLPFVLAGSRMIDQAYSVVASDNYKIGRLAAEHLIECGFQRLVFMGQTVWDDERLRLQGFQETIAKLGRDFFASDVEIDEYFVRDNSAHYATNVDRLVRRLSEFEVPFAIFCPNSVIARGLVEACKIAKLMVPDEVGILGVNSDPLECESTTPTVSTVMQQSRKIGFRACELLDNLVVRQMANHHQFLEPKGIAVRRSTDVTLVGDPSVETALRFIRDHVGRGIGVAEVVSAAGVSRRSLEIKFRRYLDRSPLAELNRVRIARAKMLLRVTESSITSIALESGFSNSQSFSVAFKKACGCSPTDFRKNS